MSFFLVLVSLLLLRFLLFVFYLVRSSVRPPWKFIKLDTPFISFTADCPCPNTYFRVLICVCPFSINLHLTQHRTPLIVLSHSLLFSSHFTFLHVRWRSCYFLYVNEARSYWPRPPRTPHQMFLKGLYLSIIDYLTWYVPVPRAVKVGD